MKISIHVGPRSMTIGTAAALLNANCRENGLSWSQWRMLLIAAPGNDYHRLRFFRVKTVPKAARKARFVRVRIRASESRFERIRCRFVHFPSERVAHNTTTTDALASVLSSSFQHKSQLFSSAPAPEASSWLACHSCVSSL